MEHIIHNLSLNMHSSISQTSLYVKSGDTKRKLRITLTENGKVYRISDGCKAVFSAKKDNGDTLFNDCTIEGNTIVYEFTAMTANVPGKIDCEIKLYDANNELITSPQFAIIVDDVVRNDEGVVASSEFSALTKLIADAIAVNKELNLKLAGGKLDFANAVKGQASGEVVALDDVSPVAHTVRCKVRSKNLLDLSQAKFSNCDYNASVNGVTSNITDAHYCGAWLYYLNDFIMANKGKTLTFSTTTTIPSDRVISIVIWGTRTDSAIVQESSSLKGVGSVSITIDDSFTSLNYVELRMNRSPIGTITDTQSTFANLQFEIGNVATEYEPYINPSSITVLEATTGATYTPKADGTCDIMSVYPTMTLMTDTEGATIECEYNRDNNMLMLDLINNVQELLKFAFKKVTTIDLLASGWQGTESPYKQTVNIPFVTKNSRVTIDLDDEQLEFFRSKDIAFTTANNGGVVTVSCVGQKPANDYSVQVTVEEVLYIE